MLLKVENIQPIQIAEISDHAEIAILTAKYDDNFIRVVWLGVKKNPTTAQLAHMVQAVQAACLACDESGVMFHLEDISRSKLEAPTIDLIKEIVGALLCNKSLIKSRLRGTVFQAQHLDGPAKIAVDLFIRLYKPIRPIVFTDEAHEVEEFATTLPLLTAR